MDAVQREHRETEFRLRQQVKELESDLKYWQERTQQLEREVQEYMGNLSHYEDLKAFAEEMQEKLAAAEEAVMGYR